MEQLDNNIQPEKNERSTFLTVLCVLTFISAGIGGMSALITPPFSEIMVSFVNMNPSFDESVKAELINIFQAGWSYYLTIFVLSATSFFGAFLMWNLKKVGFHFYALSNLALLFLPTLFLGTTTNIGSILFTASFIGMYAIHLKLLK